MFDANNSCLSDAQLLAVCHDTGPALVIAGPGSGKTRVITHRIQYLAENLGVSPERILVITFTKAAALEMQERTKNLIGKNAERVSFGTFHSIFFRILKAEGLYSPSSVIKVSEKNAILRDICAEKNIEARDMAQLYSSVAADISTYKCLLRDKELFVPKSLGSELFHDVFNMYEKHLEDRRQLDFDDLLLKTYELLDSSPEARNAWQNRFDYILIDEFQDIDELQFMTIRLLLTKSQNLFVVGDDDQSIYSFRGARPEIMLSFMEVFPAANRIELNTNYRSKSEIVEAAGRLIANNKSRFDKKIVSGSDGGGSVEVLSFASRNEQADYIRNEIQKENGSIAVLTRTNRDAGFFSDEMGMRNIEHATKQKSSSIYSHFIAKDIAAYVKMALGNRERSVLFMVMNKPDRGISRQAVKDSIVDISLVDEKVRSLYDRLSRLPRLSPFAALNYIYKAVGYRKYLCHHAEEYGVKIDELEAIFFQIQEASRGYKNLKAWLEMAEREEFDEPKSGTPKLGIITAHASKGLEYDVVFIIDVVEGIFPYKDAESEAALEEERRLFYVAMTRAKLRLVICQVDKIRERETAGSRFVEEILG